MRRRKQIRLREYDYANPGSYFFTICTREWIDIFGEIVNGEMICNDNGREGIVQSCWNELPSHYTNIHLDGFQVMPNHVHGIVVVVDDLVGSRHASTLQRTTKLTLGNIIGSFKSAVTQRINELRHKPGARVWQYRFHDHIIRSERSLNRIREYIRNNPQRWTWDRENPKCEWVDDFDRWLKEGKEHIPKGKKQ